MSIKSVNLELKLVRLIETIDSRITESKNDIDEVDKMFETFLAEAENFRMAVEEENSPKAVEEKKSRKAMEEENS
jgi:hypothetical protein